MNKNNKVSAGTRKKLSELFMEVLTEHGSNRKEVNEFAAQELTKALVKESFNQSRLTGLKPEVICLSAITLIRSGQVEKALEFAKSASVNIH